MAEGSRLKTEARPFHSIVSDLRDIVFSVVRDRPNSTGGVDSLALGTGFFVKEDVFITCEHVMNPSVAPHRSGDSYRVIANLNSSIPRIHTVVKPEVGKELSLFPNLDLAILVVSGLKDQNFAAICYEDVAVGEEIGVVGYPLATLRTDASGNLTLEGLIYRAGKGVVTGRPTGSLRPDAKDLSLVEVNFMFVAGNSGGPIFRAETGHVVGMVHGIIWHKISEQPAQANPETPLFPGLSPNYIYAIHAVYSWAIKLDCFRIPLDGFGIVP